MPVVITGMVCFPRRDDDAGDDGDDANREPTIFLNDVQSLAQIVAGHTERITVRLREGRTTPTELAEMKRLFVERKGVCPVTVVFSLKNGAEAVLSLRDYRVEVGDPLLSGLERVFGEQVAEV